jgi:hypothetical protein
LTAPHLRGEHAASTHLSPSRLETPKQKINAFIPGESADTYYKRIRRKVKKEVECIACRKQTYDQDGERILNGDWSKGCPKGSSRREKGRVREEALTGNFS